MIWELEYQSRPWLLNAERSGGSRGIGGRQGRSRLTREWRAAYADLAISNHVPPLQTIIVEAIPVCRDQRRPDVGNVFPAVKAAIDGLVDAGVVPDDTDVYLQGLMFRPALILGYSALRLQVSGERCGREEIDARERAYRKKLIKQFVT